MESGDVINPRNAQGFTPLHAAARGGHLQLCNAIQEKIQYRTRSQKTTFLNPYDKNGLTPLHQAAYFGHSLV